MRREQLGPDHPDTLTSLNSLASMYRAAGQLDKALPLFEQALAMRNMKLGPDHPATLASLNNLAGAYRAAGQFAKAVPLFEQTLAKRTEKLGPDHPDTVTSMNNLALGYLEVGLLDKTPPLLEQTLAKFKKKLGPDHPATLISMNNLALAYQGKGDFAKAESLLRECLNIYQQKQPDSWRTFDMQSKLGDNLLSQKKYDAAEPLLLAGYDGMKQREAMIPANNKNLTEALKRLVQLYDAWGKKDEAAKWRKELEAAQAEAKKPSRK